MLLKTYVSAVQKVWDKRINDVLKAKFVSFHLICIFFAVAKEFIRKKSKHGSL